MKRFVVFLLFMTQSSVFFGQERHIVVAADGSGDFITVQEAVNSIRAYMPDRTYTIWIQGVDFTAESITFENNAEQLGQAVAVHVDGDKAIFRHSLV